MKALGGGAWFTLVRLIKSNQIKLYNDTKMLILNGTTRMSNYIRHKALLVADIHLQQHQVPTCMSGRPREEKFAQRTTSPQPFQDGPLQEIKTDHSPPDTEIKQSESPISINLRSRRSNYPHRSSRPTRRYHRYAVSSSI